MPDCQTISSLSTPVGFSQQGSFQQNVPCSTAPRGEHERRLPSCLSTSKIWRFGTLPEPRFTGDSSSIQRSRIYRIYLFYFFDGEILLNRRGWCMKCKSNRFCQFANDLDFPWIDIQGMLTCCVRPLGPQSPEDTEVSKSQRLH